MSDREQVSTDIEFIRHMKKHGGETMKKCFQCATCSVACALSPKEYAFPRKEMIWASWGLKDKLVYDPDIWLCHGCMDCSQQCPRGARPADLMAGVRSYIYRNYAYPGFMGKAFSDPKYLIWLFLVPVIVIFGIVLWSQGGDMSQLFVIRGSEIEFSDFAKHGPLEMVFIAGNILIFAFAYITFKRYWDDLERHYDRPAVRGFWASAFDVVKEFLAHKKFDKCPTNSNRYWGHIYVFYGFIGTLIATAFVVLDSFIVDFLPYPMSIIHPLKLFGMISGTLLVIGGLLLLIKRARTPERESKSTYNDLLFLWVLWGVALTGMLTVMGRLTQETLIAYPVYFVHLVLVFFLLWYMPYSKFAHMIYRFLGLTFLKMRERDNKPVVFTNGKNTDTKKVTDEVTAS
ncbi:MAG: quinone-interacting membrane-bound oxidoreductase complex subunit QmoC [Candidatus Kapaibacterium sp.]